MLYWAKGVEGGDGYREWICDSWVEEVMLILLISIRGKVTMFNRIVMILTMAVLIGYSNACILGSGDDGDNGDKKDEETRRIKVEEASWGEIKEIFAGGGGKDEG